MAYIIRINISSPKLFWKGYLWYKATLSIMYLLFPPRLKGRNLNCLYFLLQILKKNCMWEFKSSGHGKHMCVFICIYVHAYTPFVSQTFQEWVNSVSYFYTNPFWDNAYIKLCHASCFFYTFKLVEWWVLICCINLRGQLFVLFLWY